MPFFPKELALFSNKSCYSISISLQRIAPNSLVYPGAKGPLYLIVYGTQGALGPLNVTHINVTLRGHRPLSNSNIRGPRPLYISIL